MTEKEIYALGLQKQAELEAEASKGALSPQQVADAIAKTASLEDVNPGDVTEKVAGLLFDAAYEEDRAKAASLLAYL